MSCLLIIFYELLVAQHNPNNILQLAMSKWQ